jgi:hypothetical protein
MTKTPGSILPDQSLVEYHFYSSYIMTNNGVAYTNLRWKVNSAYDVDPLVGSTAIAGFTEMAALYGSYRVLGIKSVMEFVNNEAFAVDVYCGPQPTLNTDPGANSIGGLDWLMNERFKHSVLSPTTGMDRISVSQDVDFSRLFSRQIATDDSFGGSVTGSPGLSIWYIAGALPAGTKTFTTAGVSVFAHLVLKTIMYSKKLFTT